MSVLKIINNNIINENKNINKHKHSVIQNIVSSKSWGAKGMGGKRPGGKRPGGKRHGGQKVGGQKVGGQKTGGQKTGGQKTGGQKSCHQRPRILWLALCPDCSSLCRMTYM